MTEASEVTDTPDAPGNSDDHPAKPIIEVIPTPTSGRERLIQIACGVGVLLQSVRFYATLPLIGFLTTRPLLYESIRPSIDATVIGAAYAKVGQEPGWLVFLLGIIGLGLVDPLRWWAGQRYGDKVARLLLPTRPKLVSRIERLVGRWGSWILVFGWFTPLPMLFVQVAAGTSGMSLRRFVIADLIGITLWEGLLFSLGYEIGKPAVKIAKTIGHYSLLIFIVVLVGVLIYAVFAGMKNYRLLMEADKAAAPDESEPLAHLGE